MSIVDEAISMIRAELGSNAQLEQYRFEIAQIVDDLRPAKLADRVLELADGTEITFSRTDGGILISSRAAYLTLGGFLMEHPDLTSRTYRVGSDLHIFLERSLEDCMVKTYINGRLQDTEVYLDKNTTVVAYHGAENLLRTLSNYNYV